MRAGRLAAKSIPIYQVDAPTAARLGERFKGQFLQAPAAAASTPVPTGYRLLGDFAPTMYRILSEAEWPVGEETEPLLTRDGRLIARVAPAFKRRLDTESSGPPAREGGGH